MVFTVLADISITSRPFLSSTGIHHKPSICTGARCQSTKEVKLWNLHSAEDGTLQGSLLHTLAGCSPVAFTPDGKTLVSGGEGGRIKIWHHVLNSSDFTFDPFLPGEWWEVLGVGMDADSEAVKLAYHQLARQYHPDVNRSASAIAKMQTINKAYEEFLKELSDCRVR
jgi:WD40 repeat protein